MESQSHRAGAVSRLGLSPMAPQPRCCLPREGAGNRGLAPERSWGAQRVGMWRCWPITLSWPTGTGAVHCSCV